MAHLLVHRLFTGFASAFFFACVVAACGGKSDPNDGTGAAGGSGGFAGQSGSGGTGGNQGGQSGTSGGWQSCTGPGQCTLASKGCCSGCSTPTIDELDAVNADKLDEHFSDVCPEPLPCPECLSGFNPFLTAICENNQCKAIDLSQNEITECTQDSDCRLRGTGCCEGCALDQSSIFALNINHFTDYLDLMCAPDWGCPACAPIYPPDLVAVCGATGHCELKTHDGCPTNPYVGDPCTHEALQCTSGDDIRLECRDILQCVNSYWELVTKAECDPLPGPGQSGCPESPVSGDCSNDGLLCDMGQGDLCMCASCVGPCSQFPLWHCIAAPSDPKCPTIAPGVGEYCSDEGAACMYGLCGTSTSAGRNCDNHQWTDEPIACPE